MKIAKKACADKSDKFVAMDIGPSGKLLAPYGDLPFEDAVAAFGKMAQWGEEAGADLILIETMSDIYEIKAAILGCKEHSSLPICITMTFDEDGKLLTGGTVAAAAAMCEALGVAAVGFNCGIGPKQVAKLLPEMLASTSLPIIINPNAGLPVEKDGKTCFEVGPEEYAELMYELAEQGVSIAGGCCGTTPEHIRSMIAKVKELPCGGWRQCSKTIVASYGKAVELGADPKIIGERIN
ncbi:5-methyltetrahydrofolate--homocysteine methyltransferase, partial [gut metagenome]